MQNLEPLEDRFPEDGLESEIIFAPGPNGIWYAYDGYGLIATAHCFGDLLKQINVTVH